MPVAQNGGEHGFLQLALPGIVVTVEESCQPSTQRFRWVTAEDFQGSFVATRNVALEVSGKNCDSFAWAGIGSIRTQRFRSATACTMARARRRLRLRIEVYRWHSAGLELILTQGTGIARSMQASNRDEGNGLA